MGEEPIPDEAVLAALARVLASAELEGSPRLQAFLRHIVEARLAGNERAMRAYAIGVDVFERPADFDPQAESLVRVEAGRLRQKLAAYYAGEGKADPVLTHRPRAALRAPLRGSADRSTGPGPDRRPGSRPHPGEARAQPSPAVSRRLPDRRPHRDRRHRRLGLERGSPTAPVEVNGAADLARQTPAIGVLPFEALDDAPGTTTVAGGLTALVTAELTHFRQFFVLARRSAWPWPSEAAATRSALPAEAASTTSSTAPCGATVRASSSPPA
ncbi:MAG: hypothetical protein R3C69_05180 [Geminicoccaceae bacterium]